MVKDYLKRYIAHLFTISHFPADKILCWGAMLIGASQYLWGKKVPENISGALNLTVLILAGCALLWTFFSAPYYAWKEAKQESLGKDSRLEYLENAFSDETKREVKGVRDFVDTIHPSQMDMQDWETGLSHLHLQIIKVPANFGREILKEVYDSFRVCRDFHVRKSCGIDPLHEETENYFRNEDILQKKVIKFIKSTDWVLK